MFQRRFEETRHQIRSRIFHCPDPVQFRDFTPELSHRTGWIFFFTERYEIQTGSMNHLFGIRPSNEHPFMSTRLQLTGEMKPIFMIILSFRTEPSSKLLP
jgi:hypothetical protein